MATRDAALALVMLLVLAGCSPAATTSPGESPAAATQGCAWPRSVNVYSANALLLGAAEQVWIDFIPVDPGLQIVLSGTFPDAR